MPDPALLQLEGAPVSKPFKKIPLSTNVWFSGLVTQRSPFASLDSRYNRKYLGGRPDQLIDGLNMEVSNYATLIRRAGTTALFNQSVAENSINGFYSFHQLNATITTMMDATSHIYTISRFQAPTSIFTKSPFSGQTFFQGVGNTLYMGDGVDQIAWNPSISSLTRNWGIAVGSINNATGPNAPGTAADIAVSGAAPWSNPNNIKVADGAFATATLTPSGGVPASSGPLNCGTGIDDGTQGAAWGNPSNIAVNGQVCSVFLDNVNSQISDGLFVTNFGFNIPSNASIAGIVFSVKRSSNRVNTIRDQSILAVKGGVAVGTDHLVGSFWPTSSTAQSYGSSSDLWGTTWTPAQINASNFGIRIQAQNGVTSLQIQAILTGTVTAIVYFTIPGGATVSDLLQGTNYGFSIPTTSTITGILVEVKGLQTQNPSTAFTATVLKAGNVIGTSKSSILPGANGFISFGGTSDLWGATWTPNDINQTNFGVSFQATSSFSGSTVFNVDFVRITIFSLGGPPVSLVAGSLTATTGYQYVFAYGNSNSGHVSNPSPVSNLVKPTAQGVQINLTASTDPQVNQIHVYRTKDGGSVYYELPTSPYPNTTQNVTDNATDATLQQLIFWPSVPTLSNTPPPAGLGKLTYHLGRIWGAVGNFVYYSGGPDTLIGNGNESFPPANFFLFPSTVNRLVPYSSGLLVFTTDDVYIILGTSIATFYAAIFQQGVGLLSYNALDILGTNIFLYTSDRQFLSLSSAGFSELGFAIGDKLQLNFDPSLVYVAAIVQGTSEKAVYVSDGNRNWYRCNWNQAPEGGPAWSPLATITGGSFALSSVETSPGIHQLLMGFTQFGQGNLGVAYRDTSGNFQDVNPGGGLSPYDSFVTFGSFILANPGQMAEIDSITIECLNVGFVPNVPSISILTDEISGTFEALPNFTNDPPELTPSTTVLSNRWYLAQGTNAARLRHMQIRVDFGQNLAKDELLTLSIFGGLIHQA